MANSVFIQLSSVRPSLPPTCPPWLALGFRPFYLLAAMWMVVSVPIWLLMFGHGSVPGSHLQSVNWHSHEMVFGFTAAVIVGFLFTAVKNWTGLPTPQGKTLFVIALTWLLARILLLTNLSAIGVFFDIGFFVLAAAGIGLPLLRSGNERNIFFIGLLLLLATLSALHHYACIVSQPFIRADQVMQLALTIIATIVTVIAGRVIPMFTSNAVAGAPVKKFILVEILSVIGVITAGISVALLPTNAVTASITFIVASIHLFRWWHWAPFWTLRKPILWILHISYLWLPISLLLRTVAMYLPMANLLATHALTVGTIAGLCLGMMSRTARGHTGRPLLASRSEIVSYLLIVSAAVVRVLFPLLLPDFYRLWAAFSGLLAIAAYGLYLSVFFPWLLQPRADARPD